MALKPSFYKRHRTLFNPNSVYNGQDILKNHFLHSHPIVYTEDTGDLTQVCQHAETSSHAWLVDSKIESLRTFPWWFKIPPDCEDTVFQFPCVYKDSWKIYSWKSVQLVPTSSIAKKFVKQRQVAGEYDILKGKQTLDRFFIGKNLPAGLLQTDVKCVSSISEAQKLSETDMLWVIPNEVQPLQSFKFNYIPDLWSLKRCHVFRNQEEFNGIILIPKDYQISRNEEAYWFFAEKKEVDINASKPARHDIFYIDTYKEYLEAASESVTPMFWVVWNDVKVRDDFDFEYYVSKQDADAMSSTHVFKNGASYDGICLFSAEDLVTRNEFEYRHFLRKIEVDIVASDPIVDV